MPQANSKRRIGGTIAFEATAFTNYLENIDSVAISIQLI